MPFLTPRHLPPECILLDRRIKAAEDLFALVAGVVAHSNPPLLERIQMRLARRHARRPVGLGGGIALPHAAVPGLGMTRAVFVRLSTPIEMGGPDRMGVTDVLALLVPSPAMAADYDLLMSLTAWLHRAATREALGRASTPAEIRALILSQAAP